jgi:hypothetical protein
MEVYIVPVGPDRYEPYCEREGLPGVDDAAAPATNWWRRQLKKFRDAVAEAEADRRRRDLGEHTDRRGIAAWVMGRIAEAVAEQRLLWHLRGETEVTLVYPDDLRNEKADTIMRGHLVADSRKHLRWCGIDGLLAAILGPGLFFVPGPNVVGWFFAFRAIGHFLSWKGAGNGLKRVTWRPRPSSRLTAIRAVLAADEPARLEALGLIGADLGLEHLPGFVNRVVRGRSYDQRR